MMICNSGNSPIEREIADKCAIFNERARRNYKASCPLGFTVSLFQRINYNCKRGEYLNLRVKIIQGKENRNLLSRRLQG
jgi:hypothetical protein